MSHPEDTCDDAEWQERENEVDAAIAEGRSTFYPDAASFLASFDEGAA